MTGYTLDQLPALITGLYAEIAELRGRVEVLEGQTPDLLSTEEAADLLGIHVNTAKQWIKSGQLPASKPAGGRNWKIHRADVLALIEAGP